MSTLWFVTDLIPYIRREETTKQANPATMTGKRREWYYRKDDIYFDSYLLSTAFMPTPLMTFSVILSSSSAALLISSSTFCPNSCSCSVVRPILTNTSFRFNFNEELHFLIASIYSHVRLLCVCVVAELSVHDGLVGVMDFQFGQINKVEWSVQHQTENRYSIVLLCNNIILLIDSLFIYL